MSTLTDLFTSLANKIRSKLGTTSKYTPAQAISAIDDVYDKGVADGATPTQEKTATAGTSAITVTPDSGYALSKVTVNPTPSQTKSATPSTSAQTISPDSGKLLSSVTINAISPARSQGTAATGSGIDGIGPWVYFPYGWYPQYGWTGNAYIYMTTEQAQAAHPHSGTYTFAANDTGETKDLGTTHGYRYVNASNVYTYGRLHPSVGIVANSSYVNVNGITTRSMSGFTSGVRYMIVLYNASGSITWAEAQKINGATLGSGGTDITNVGFWTAGSTDTRFACRGILFTATSTSVSIKFSSALGNYTVVFLSLKLS